MLSLGDIRKNCKDIEAGLKKKDPEISLDDLLKVDQGHRAILHNLNEMRSERNKASEEIAEVKRSGENADEAIKRMRTVSRKIKEMEREESQLTSEIRSILIQIPNIPHKSVPVGKTEADNTIVRDWGNAPEFDFATKDHIALGEALELFDFKRGAKISGSGFPLYTGKGARLERALLNYMLDFHTSENGYKEIFPPFAATYESMEMTGQLPKFSDDMYKLEMDDVYLIPTAEVPVTNIHRDEVLDLDYGPVKYAAYSACFRREAGSYGKETRGFLRLHQFNKVELVKFCKPENSYNELEDLTLQAEKILQNLGLHYRVMELCSGDLSFAAAKCYDLEVWAPVERKWLEVSSCSNFEDFQARRGNVRYRNEEKKLTFVHTLNGSGVATPRLLVALLETYQREDGSISLPKPLQPYFGSKVLD